MVIKDIMNALEEFAPLQLQEDYDNSGLQAGIAVQELKGILIALDVTEEVVDEAIRRGCNMVVTHHPLIFRPLKKVSDLTYQQRCVVKALKNDVVLYAAHTNLDNVEGGVNHRIAAILGLKDLEWLDPKPVNAGRQCGSGLIGSLPEPEDAEAFLRKVKDLFNVPCLMHSALPQGQVKKVAVCGGSGSFLIPDALAKGADCFLTGEISYHHFFENDGLLVAALGHYQSEQFTKELLKDIILDAYTETRIELMPGTTDPVSYMI